MQRLGYLRRTLFVVLLLFVGGMAAITAYTLSRLRAENVVTGLESSAMHAHSFEDFLTQSLHVTELLAAYSVAPDTADFDERRIQNDFVAILRHAPFLRSMSLLDESGRIIASSNPLNVGIELATQSYLPPVASAAEILRIGAPWSGRDFAAGKPATPTAVADADLPGLIPVIRTLTVGKRNVTLLFALNPDYFIDHFARMVSAEEGSVEVLRYDGILLFGTDPALRAGAQRD